MNTRPNPTPRRALIVRTLIACVFLGSAIYTAREDWEANDASFWPKVSGTISDVSFEERPRKKFGTYYEARVLYRYEVAGKSYVGSREAFHPPRQSSGSEAVHYAASTYQPGSTHDVFYNPDNPSESVLLNPAVNLGRTGILCAIFGTIGLVLLGVTLHEWQQNRPPPKKNARFLGRASLD